MQSNTSKKNMQLKKSIAEFGVSFSGVAAE
jgi:hypothetical protein